MPSRATATVVSEESGCGSEEWTTAKRDSKTELGSCSSVESRGRQMSPTTEATIKACSAASDSWFESRGGHVIGSNLCSADRRDSRLTDDRDRAPESRKTLKAKSPTDCRASPETTTAEVTQDSSTWREPETGTRVYLATKQTSVVSRIFSSPTRFLLRSSTPWSIPILVGEPTMRSSALAALAATSTGTALLCFATTGVAVIFKAASVDAFVQPRQHVVAARGPGSVQHAAVSPRHHHHARPGFTGAVTIPATAFSIPTTRLHSSLSNQDRETSRRSAPSRDSTTALSVSSAVPVQQLDPSPPKVPPPPLPSQQRKEGQVSSNEQVQELSATAGFALTMVAATVGLVGLAFLLPQYQEQQQQTSVVTAVKAVKPPAAVVVSDGGSGGAKLAPGTGGGGGSSALESVGIKNIITSAERQQQQRPAAGTAAPPAASAPSSAAPTAATPAVITTDVHHMVTGAAERTATTGSGTGSGGEIGISTAAAASPSASASSVGTLTTGTVAEVVSADKLAAGTVTSTSTSDAIGGKDGGAASARGSAGVDTDVKPNIGTNMNMNANTKAIDIDNKADGKEAAPTATSSAADVPSAASGTVVKSTVIKSDAVANIAVESQKSQQVAAKEAASVEVLNGKDKEETEPDEFGNTYAAMVQTENKVITTDTEKSSSKVLAAPSAAAAAAEKQQPKTAEPVALQATASAQPEVASNDNKDDETDEFGNTYAIEMEAADAKVDTNMKEVSKAPQSSTNAAATKEIAAPATTSTKPTRVATSFSVYSERKSDFLIKPATPDGASKAASSVSDARLPIYTERH